VHVDRHTSPLPAQPFSLLPHLSISCPTSHVYQPDMVYPLAPFGLETAARSRPYGFRELEIGRDFVGRSEYKQGFRTSHWTCSGRLWMLSWPSFIYMKMIPKTGFMETVGKPSQSLCSYGQTPPSWPFEASPEDSLSYHGNFVGRALSTKWPDSENSWSHPTQGPWSFKGSAPTCSRTSIAKAAGLTKYADQPAHKHHPHHRNHQGGGNQPPDAPPATANYPALHTAMMLKHAQGMVTIIGWKGTVIESGHVYRPTFSVLHSRIQLAQTGSSGHVDRPTCLRVSGCRVGGAVARASTPEAMSCSKCGKEHPRGMACPLPEAVEGNLCL
jgi:hypothetical protein